MNESVRVRVYVCLSLCMCICVYTEPGKRITDVPVILRSIIRLRGSVGGRYASASPVTVGMLEKLLSWLTPKVSSSVCMQLCHQTFCVFSSCLSNILFFLVICIRTDLFFFVCLCICGCVCVCVCVCKHSMRPATAQGFHLLGEESYFSSRLLSFPFPVPISFKIL